MRFAVVQAFLTAGLLVAASSVTRAQQAVDPLYRQPVDEESAAPVDETSALWFVELQAAPVIEGSSVSAIQSEQQSFRAQASAAGVRFGERFTYGLLWNGMSVRVDQENLAALRRLQGVKAVWPVVAIAQAQVTSDLLRPELFSALAMTGADIAHSELGLSGAGIQVAVIDSGIDYEHPDLGGCFGPGCRVAFGYDFVGDAFNADWSSPWFNPVPVPDFDPDDCGGHGTHVAGIIGGSPASLNGVRGVAPGVTLGAYRVFGCDGSTTADIMLAAMEQALADGMDVLNMSIGSPYQWPQYPTAVAADRLVKAGMVVVASIGNSGATGVYSASAPGVGRDVIGVAAFDNLYTVAPQFTISPDDMPIAYDVATGVPPPMPGGTLTLAATGTVVATADACSPLPEGSLEGKAALIRRGGCGFYLKARNAELAGAAAVVFYNNIPGRFGATVLGDPPVSIPVVTITDTDGMLIDSRIASDEVTLTWQEKLGLFPIPGGGLLSWFSSYGLAPDLSLKPDIGAPGGYIYSTYPLEYGAYTTLSGTSMASPHVAGAAALLLEARPRLSAREVRDVLQNSADPQPWWGNPDLGYLENVHAQGAGLVDIDGAVLATTRVAPGKLALGESERGRATQTLVIYNDSRSPVTYTFSHEPALATGGSTFWPEYFAAFADVELAPATATVRGRSSVRVRVSVTPPSGPELGIYGGYIVVSAQGGDTYRVPYAGFIGDYQSVVALTPTYWGFPWLAKLPGYYYEQQVDGAVFSMARDDVPYVLLHLEHPVERLVLDVVSAADGRRVGVISDERFVGRNGDVNGFFSYLWDGTLTVGNDDDDDDDEDDEDDDDGDDDEREAKKVKIVRDGDYFIEVRVEKALGRGRNPAHVERWTSPLFTIARP